MIRLEALDEVVLCAVAVAGLHLLDEVEERLGLRDLLVFAFDFARALASVSSVSLFWVIPFR